METKNTKNIYVSKDTAILLKNAGFDIECNVRIPYNISSLDNSYSGCYVHCKELKNWNADEHSLSAPTVNVVNDWLLKKYEIEIKMQCHFARHSFIPTWYGYICPDSWKSFDLDYYHHKLIYEGNDNFEESLDKTIQTYLNTILNH